MKIFSPSPKKKGFNPPPHPRFGKKRILDPPNGTIPNPQKAQNYGFPPPREKIKNGGNSLKLRENLELFKSL